MRVTLVHILSIGSKIGANTLAVAGPIFLMDSPAYGEYALILSAVLISGAVLDTGAGLQGSVMKGNAQRQLLRFVNLRDMASLAVVGALLLGGMRLELVVGALGAILTARWTSVSGILRGEGAHRVDLRASLLGLIFTAGIIAALYGAYFGEVWRFDDSRAAQVIALVICVPRAIATVVAGRAAGKLLRRLSAPEIASTPPYRPSFAFAGPAVLAACASNVDVIVASAFVPIQLVGALKMATMTFGVLVLLPELISQSVQTRLSRGIVTDDYWQVMARAFRHFGWLYYSAGAVCLTLAVSLPIRQATPTLIGAGLAMTVGLFFRVNSYKYASLLTITGRQLSRFRITLITLAIYLPLIPVIAMAEPMIALPLALTLASIAQWSAFRRVAGRVSF